MFLLYHEIFHLTVGFFIGALYYFKTRDFKLLIIAVLTSLLLDAGHWVDYLLFALPSKNIILVEFFSTRYFAASGKIYVPLHNYELVMVLGGIGALFRKYRYHLWTVSIAILAHILIDQLTYKPVIWEYFLTYRVLNNFSISVF